jgi:ParB family transcriptional regulator, chromosome partitioning protein
VTNAKFGLGKGFDALIPTDFDSNLLIDTNDRVQNLFITDIIPNPDQPRKHFDDKALAELASSIMKYGILQPLIVSPNPAGKYFLIAGERRWRAAQLAGLDKVPAIIRKREELEQLEISLIENVQRVDLSPIEQAVSVERLHQQFNLSYKIIAERLGKAETTISNIVRLLQLPVDAREALQANKISEGHARAILALKGQLPLQQELLRNIIEHGWSVRQAEQFVTGRKQGAKTHAAVKEHMAHETPETKLIGAALKTSVTLKRTARGGRVEIHFKNDKDLEHLLKRLSELS